MNGFLNTTENILISFLDPENMGKNHQNEIFMMLQCRVIVLNRQTTAILAAILESFCLVLCKLGINGLLNATKSILILFIDTENMGIVTKLNFLQCSNAKI